MTNLLVFTIVVWHSCITPTHIQEDLAGTSISSDEVSVSAQPVSQPHDATSLPKPAAQTGSTTPSKGASSNELTYKAYLKSARAFANIEEKSKAVESYEKAILAAPNEKCRKATIEELNSFTAKYRRRWFLHSFKLFLQTVQPFFVWIIIVLLLLCLRRLWHWLLRKKLYRVLIVPTSSREIATYFCDLIRYAHDSFEEQRALVSQISQASSRTIAPTCQSANIIAELPFNFPDAFAGKWWSPLVNPVVNKIDPPNYILHLGVLDAEKQYSLTLRLCKKSKLLGHWLNSCDNVSIHGVLQDMAYQVVVNINRQERKVRHDA